MILVKAAEQHSAAVRPAHGFIGTNEDRHCSTCVCNTVYYTEEHSLKLNLHRLYD